MMHICLLVAVLLFASAAFAQEPACVYLEISANGHERYDKPVGTDLDFTVLLKNAKRKTNQKLVTNDITHASKCLLETDLQIC